VVRALSVGPEGKFAAGFYAPIYGSFNSLVQYESGPFGFNSQYASFTAVPVYALAYQPDGKLLVGGAFYPGLVRMLTNGVRDTNFICALPFSTVTGVRYEPNDRILLGGSLAAAHLGPRQAIARLKPDGTEAPLSLQAGPDGTASAVASLTNGAVLVAGEFAGVDGFERHGLVRLNGFLPLFNPARSGQGSAFRYPPMSERIMHWSLTTPFRFRLDRLSNSTWRWHCAKSL
jgi:hypothetical protein